MTAYDNWLEKPYQDASEKQDAIDEIAEELLTNECNSQDPSVFMEAINEGACLTNERVYNRLKEILAKGHSYAEIGELVWDEVNAYCEETAIQRAEQIITLRKN